MNGHGLLGRMLGDQMIVNGMLVVIAVSTLTFAYRHLRHVRGQRQSAHSRARRAPDTGRVPSPANPPGPAADGGRRTGGDPWMSPPPRAAAGHKKPAGKPAPARPAAARPAPAGPAPAAAPSAASAAVHADDYPSWPGRPGPGALHPDHPSWPGRPDPRWAAAEAALRADDYASWPGGQAAPVPTPVPAPVPAPAPAPAWDAGSVELAGWILSEANAHAAEIRHEARDEAAASLADAKKEAADLMRKASDRAAAKLAAVESEAAQVQAALMKLSTELGEAAATTLHPAAD
jgi:hypothetical protein